MNKFLLIAIALFSTSTFAAPVYKCKNASGQVIYQNQQCPEQAQMQEVEILTVNPSVIENAQKKLQEDLKAQAEIDAEQSAQSFKQRQLNAVEKNNTVGDTIAERTQNQTNYLQNKFNRNTDIKYKPVDY